MRTLKGYTKCLTLTLRLAWRQRRSWSLGGGLVVWSRERRGEAGLSEERRGWGISRRSSALIGRSWGKEGTQDECGFLAGSGDSQGDEEFLGRSNLGERLGVPFIDLNKQQLLPSYIPTGPLWLPERRRGATVG